MSDATRELGVDDDKKQEANVEISHTRSCETMQLMAFEVEGGSTHLTATPMNALHQDQDDEQFVSTFCSSDIEASDPKNIDPLPAQGVDSQVHVAPSNIDSGKTRDIHPGRYATSVEQLEDIGIFNPKLQDEILREDVVRSHCPGMSLKRIHPAGSHANVRLLVIDHLHPLGSAHKSDILREGDIICSVDGIGLNDCDVGHAQDLLVGAAASVVCIEFVRPPAEGTYAQYAVPLELIRDMPEFARQEAMCHITAKRQAVASAATVPSPSDSIVDRRIAAPLEIAMATCIDRSSTDIQQKPSTNSMSNADQLVQDADRSYCPGITLISTKGIDGNVTRFAMDDPHPLGSAHKSDLRVGDIILSVDGISLHCIDERRAQDLLAGVKSSVVYVEFVRPSVVGSAAMILELIRDVPELARKILALRRQKIANAAAQPVSVADNITRAVTPLPAAKYVASPGPSREKSARVGGGGQSWTRTIWQCLPFNCLNPSLPHDILVDEPADPQDSQPLASLDSKVVVKAKPSGSAVAVAALPTRTRIVAQPLDALYNGGTVSSKSTSIPVAPSATFKFGPPTMAARPSSPKPQAVATSDSDLPESVPAEWVLTVAREAFAHGSYKSAYRAQLGPLDIPVAVLRCRARPGDARAAAAVSREAAALRRLPRHPHLLRFFRAEAAADGAALFVTELCPGGPLSDWLAAAAAAAGFLGTGATQAVTCPPDSGGARMAAAESAAPSEPKSAGGGRAEAEAEAPGPSPLGLSVGLAVCAQVARGLACLAEAGFVHRDIAAHNVLVVAEDPIHVKIADFGSCMVYGESADGEGNHLPPEGEDRCPLPLRWAAPELLSAHGAGIGSKDGDALPWSKATDVYAFGATAWQVFSGGEVPFTMGISDEEVTYRVLSTLDTEWPPLQRPAHCPANIYQAASSPPLRHLTAPKLMHQMFLIADCPLSKTRPGRSLSRWRARTARLRNASRKLLTTNPTWPGPGAWATLWGREWRRAWPGRRSTDRPPSLSPRCSRRLKTTPVATT